MGGSKCGSHPDACCLCPQMTIWECAGKKWGLTSCAVALDLTARPPTQSAAASTGRPGAWTVPSAPPRTQVLSPAWPSEALPHRLQIQALRSLSLRPSLRPLKSPQTQPLRPVCPSPSLNLGPLVPKSHPKDLPVLSAGPIVPVPCGPEVWTLNPQLLVSRTPKQPMIPHPPNSGPLLLQYQLLRLHHPGPQVLWS